MKEWPIQKIVQDLWIRFKHLINKYMRVVIVVGTVESVDRNIKTPYVGRRSPLPSGCWGCFRYRDQLSLWKESG
jgi:hypothetical protein